MTLRGERVAYAALPRFGLPADASVRLVHYRENEVFRVGASGEPHAWALRVHRIGYRTAVEIASEIAWMEALAVDGIATAQPRRTLDGDVVASIEAPDSGERLLVSMSAWIEGRALADDDSSDTYALVGSMSARIQRHGRTWRPPTWFSRPVWSFAHLVGPRALWGDYADVSLLGGAERRTLDRAASAVRDRLDRFGCDSDRFGLTHADLMPDNVLMEGETAHVIDFDDCGYGWYLYDLATLLALRCGDPDCERVRDAWITGYRTVAPLSDEHVAVLDSLVMARLLLGVGWMHTRRDTDLARALTATVIEMACTHAERLLTTEKTR